MGQDVTAIQRQCWDYFRDKGAPTWVTWALLGNIQRECSFNWSAVGDKASGGAHHLFQWHDARAEDIQAATGIDVTDPHATLYDGLNAFWWEVHHAPGYSHVWDALMTTKDIAGACTILVRDYERAKLTQRDVALNISFAETLRKAHQNWEVTG